VAIGTDSIYGDTEIKDAAEELETIKTIIQGFTKL
jgi:hypothetical protein